MIGMSIFPRKTIPLLYAAYIASRSPSRRGAGVAPPSGERFMLRALQTSMFPGVHGPTKGQPSCTISDDCFQEPTLAFRSRNSAGVILPSRNACRPYWTPTLSHGERA